MRLWISALIVMLGMFMVSMTRPAAADMTNAQAQFVNALYLSPGAYYGHWHGTCRDPHFRRHHRFLCW